MPAFCLNNRVKWGYLKPGFVRYLSYGLFSFPYYYFSVFGQRMRWMYSCRGTGFLHADAPKWVGNGDDPQDLKVLNREQSFFFQFTGKTNEHMYMYIYMYELSFYNAMMDVFPGDELSFIYLRQYFNNIIRGSLRLVYYDDSLCQRIPDSICKRTDPIRLVLFWYAESIQLLAEKIIFIYGFSKWTALDEIRMKDQCTLPYGWCHSPSSFCYDRLTVAWIHCLLHNHNYWLPCQEVRFSVTVAKSSLNLRPYWSNPEFIWESRWSHGCIVLLLNHVFFNISVWDHIFYHIWAE